MESTLITTVNLKKLTSISNSVDVDLLNPYLLIAQQTYIEPLLGEALYSDLLNKFDTNSLNADEEVLINDYLTQAIAYSAWFSAAPFLSYKTQRVGIVTTVADNSTALTPEEMRIYITKIEGFKEMYCERTTNFLEKNLTKFPLYRSNNYTPDSTNGGIYLGFNKRNKNCDSNNW